MTQQFCERCRRIHYGKHDCLKHRDVPAGIVPMFHCDTLAVEPADVWESRARKTCQACPHWQEDRDRAGCELIPLRIPDGRANQPCDIGYHWHRGRQCFDDPPRYPSRAEFTAAG